jgi:hypothetical protein
MASHYNGSRSRSRTQRHRQEPDDRHSALKTSLQVIGLLICLRVLLPRMFPSEHDRGGDGEYERGQRGPYNDRRTDYTYESYEELPRSRVPETSERDRGERARITYEEPDENGSDLDGTTVYGSESGRERRRELRERRRRIGY